MMPLIIIGGAQRSGTTLLQTLLANTAGSPNLPETHILADIFFTYRRAKEFENKTRIFYPTDESLLAFFRTFAEQHVADIALGRDASNLVLKDPNFIHTLEEAAAVFPDCIRIVCMRDPRDIVASFLQIGQREQEAPGKPPSKYKKRDVNAISKKVLASYQPLLAAMPPGVQLVRYEELVSDPRGTLRTLAGKTGLELSLDRIENGEWLEAEARHGAAWITELEGSGPSTANVGSFKRIMTDEEVGIVQKVCEPIFKQFGYELMEFPPGPKDKPKRLFWFGRSRKGKR